MQTKISPLYQQMPYITDIEKILRSCVHCGFCNATCPTYQITGNELDGPRGRIYQIKQILEGENISASAHQHLDRCLECRNCETTCPSGVEYARLLHFGKQLVLPKQPKLINGLKYLLAQILAYPSRVMPLLKIGQFFKPLLPKILAKKIPISVPIKPKQWQTHQRKMLILDGCVQSVMTPQTNHHIKTVLDKLAIQVDSVSGCCGGLHQHLGQPATATIQQNIDNWLTLLAQEYECFIYSASGCGLSILKYPDSFTEGSEYHQKATLLTSKVRDISEVLIQEDLSIFNIDKQTANIAFHPPCTLQHGLKLQGLVEEVLQKIGYSLQPINDAHLCCGSAGPYSILHPKISTELVNNKWANIGGVDLVITANVGCELHLSSARDIPVKHWITCFQ